MVLGDDGHSPGGWFGGIAEITEEDDAKVLIHEIETTDALETAKAGLRRPLL